MKMMDTKPNFQSEVKHIQEALDMRIDVFNTNLIIL